MKKPTPTSGFLVGILMICTASTVAWDPGMVDDPETHAAAREALSVAPPPLLIRSEIRDVPGMATGLEAKGLALRASIELLENAMAELDAQVLDEEIRVSLSSDVLFDFDQHSLRPEAETELERLALIVREKARGSVRIVGHTDAKGSDEYNQALSERRANSVKLWLREHGGLNPGLILETKGFGETGPVAPNQTPDGKDYPQGRALNRRVEVFIETIE